MTAGGASGTALHHAAYLGKDELVAYLMNLGADVNKRNREGDTPLHRAAYAGRGGVIQTLLRDPTINMNAENNDGKRPVDLAHNSDIVKMFNKARRDLGSATTLDLFEAGRTGDAERFFSIASQPSAGIADPLAQDPHNGNTLLHYASKFGHHEFIVHLLRRGAKADAQNSEKANAASLAKSEKTRQVILSGAPASANTAHIGKEPVMAGHLERWRGVTLGGWAKRYVTYEKDG